MQRELDKWYSPILGKEMEIAIYGHYGLPVLLFPSTKDDFMEPENYSLISSVSRLVDYGRCKIFVIPSIDEESWNNPDVYPPHKSLRHGQYNHYIISEVIPYIFESCRGEQPIISCGASKGAFHAANTYFRHPDLFKGLIAMSGVYDLQAYSHGYYDDHIYFNSPVSFIPNITDESYLDLMRDNRGIIIASGQGTYEDPHSVRQMSQVLSAKRIPHFADIWGFDMHHHWETWKRMLPYFLGEKIKL